MIQIGVIGTGRIAQRFVKDVRMVKNARISCVYNPREGSAEKFVEMYCENTEDFNSKDIMFTSNIETLLSHSDAVYIASPHETHFEYAKQALLADKHVLCEKPMTLLAAETEELFHIAQIRHLVLREAVKTAYCPGFLKLLEVAQSGVIGEICDVEAAFTKLESTGNRELVDIKTGGSVTELGTYGMLPIFKLLGLDYKEVHAQSLKAPNGIDIYSKLFFTYENSMATAKMGLGVKSEGELLISGTKGYIHVESPWWLTKRFEVRFEDPQKKEVYEEDFIGNGLVYELLAFLEECKGNSSQIGVTQEETLAMINVIEQFLTSAQKERNI